VRKQTPDVLPEHKRFK